MKVFGTSVLGKCGLTSLYQPAYSVKYDPTGSVKFYFHLGLVKSAALKVNRNIQFRFFLVFFFVCFFVDFCQTHPHNSATLKASDLKCFCHFI